VLDPNHPAGICGSLAKMRMQAVKMAGVKPSDLKFTNMASIALSPRQYLLGILVLDPTFLHAFPLNDL
jgi:hypothetical protein